MSFINQYTLNTGADYNHYSAYLKKNFLDKKIYKISIDADFTCPNRDGSKGYGGCHYCNVDSFTPPTNRKNPSIVQQIQQSKEAFKKLYGATHFIAYFQSNTNTYAPVEVLKKLYDKALETLGNEGVGLAIGTRIDCLDEEKLDLIESYSQKYPDITLEIGIESIYDQTLSQINRGHGIEELENGLKEIEKRNISLCVHTIFGLPGESTKMQLDVAPFLNRFKIDFLKLHQLHVVKHSVFGTQYQKKPFPTYSLEKYCEFLSQFIPLLKPDITLQRLFGTSYGDTLIAPKWGLSRSKIQHTIENYLIQNQVVQGSKYTATEEAIAQK